MTGGELNSVMNMQEEAKRRVMDMANRSRFAAEDMNRKLYSSQTDQKNGGVSEASGSAGTRVFPGMSREEAERMFIMSLCLLLGNEQADESLILGLMYLLT